MGKSHLEVSYSSDYEDGDVFNWQTTLRSLLFKRLGGGKGKSLLDVSYSSDYDDGIGKPLLQISYSSDYDGGRAIQSYKSPIKVTMRWDGHTTLRSLVFKVTMRWDGQTIT